MLKCKLVFIMLRLFWSQRCHLHRFDQNRRSRARFSSRIWIHIQKGPCIRGPGGVVGRGQKSRVRVPLTDIPVCPFLLLLARGLAPCLLARSANGLMELLSSFQRKYDLPLSSRALILIFWFTFFPLTSQIRHFWDQGSQMNLKGHSHKTVCDNSSFIIV
jgi:hypothetical protein